MRLTVSAPPRHQQNPWRASWWIRVETSELLSGPEGEQLLEALGISRADLALRLVAGGEDERLTLIQSMQDLAAAAGEIDRVRELAAEIREHPEIIDSIEERKNRRSKIQRNQQIGRLVEHLLQQELEACGLTVRRTGIGSDFEVESDFVEDEEEIGLELAGAGGSTLIEVKSTRVDQVKMTPAQARRACSLHDRFALCVVPLDGGVPTGETVREQLRVVFNVGAHLESTVADYETLEQLTDDARQPHGAVALEIVEGEVRFRIGSAIWGRALTFEQAVEQFRKGKLTAAGTIRFSPLGVAPINSRPAKRLNRVPMPDSTSRAVPCFPCDRSLTATAAAARLRFGAPARPRRPLRSPVATAPVRPRGCRLPALIPFAWRPSWSDHARANHTRPHTRLLSISMPLSPQAPMGRGRCLSKRQDQARPPSAARTRGDVLPVRRVVAGP